MSGCATRSKISGCATRSKISGCATRSKISGCATRSKISGCATRSKTSGQITRKLRTERCYCGGAGVCGSGQIYPVTPLDLWKDLVSRVREMLSLLDIKSLSNEIGSVEVRQMRPEELGLCAARGREVLDTIVASVAL
ncbi:hypothetical protein XELAEV_18032759mg [Xenopus laevis]|uniref:Uncharacterized protein n=1 Tax=Xenopus laevis TaxID=8355 RepID=A0A974CI44_XENLA|nr:hypothetical protein XELAEV_18032759mg [Xenopus laevis]